MPAPRRASTRTSTKPVRPEAIGMTGGITSPRNYNQISIILPTTHRQDSDLALEKFAMLIMYIVALIAIWGGIFTIGFANADTESYLLLFVGGFVSAAMAIGMVEMQARKQGMNLQESQNYMLGLGFFFAAVGIIWGARYFVDISTDLGINFLVDSASSSGITPSVNAIYMQAGALALIVLGEYLLLKRYEGHTGFAWGVAALTPLALLLGGSSNWMNWSDNVVSYEIGISMVFLSFISMEVAFRSNRSNYFIAMAIISGLIPFFYEANNDPFDGGALSLLIFIIAIQGWYAEKEMINFELMQKASAGLVAIVFAAMLYAYSNDFELILGPFRTSELTGLASSITLPIGLWIALLISYFPAVLKQRVPAMPIGLALALGILPFEGAWLAWIITVLIIQYMIFINQDARKWVIDFTLTALAFSFIFTDVRGITLDMEYSEIFALPYMEIALPVILVATASAASYAKKSSPWTDILMMVCVGFSRGVITTQSELLPWIFSGYLIALAIVKLNKATMEDIGSRKDGTLYAFLAFAVTIILSLNGSLTAEAFGIDFDYDLMIIGLILYAIFRRTRDVEIDFGVLIAWLDNSANSNAAKVWNSEANAWVMSETKEKVDITEKSWNKLSKITILGPLLVIVGSIITLPTEILTETYLGVSLFLLPVAILAFEVLSQKEQDASTRVTSSWMLFLIALPIAIVLHTNDHRWTVDASWTQCAEVAIIGASCNFELYTNIRLVFDGILLLACALPAILLQFRGLKLEEMDRSMDHATMFALIAIALLDTSGGLLVVGMLALITWKSIQHKHSAALLASPGILVLLGWSWLEPGHLSYALSESVGSGYNAYEYSSPTGIPQLSGIIMTIQMGIVWLLSSFTRDGTEDYPFIGSIIWVIIGVLSASTGVAWFPAILVCVISVSVISRGAIEFIQFVPIAMLISLIIGFSSTEMNDPLQVISWSATATAGFTALFYALTKSGTIFVRYNPEQDLLEYNARNPEFPQTEEEFMQMKTRNMLEVNETFIIVNLLLSFAILGGVLNIIGALYATERTFKRGRKFSLPLIPVLHSLTIGNAYFLAFGSDVEITGTMIAGFVMVVEGIGIYVLGMQEDFMWDSNLFAWEDDEEFFNVIGTLGISGLFSSLVGLILIFNNDSNWIVVTLAMTLMLTAVGVQGFQERYDARWRRAIGGFGSIISGLIFAASVDDSLFGAVAFIFVGLLAFGYAALWTQRSGSDTAILDDPFAVMHTASGIAQEMPSMPTLLSPGSTSSAMNASDDFKIEASKKAKDAAKVANAVGVDIDSEEIEEVFDEISDSIDEVEQEFSVLEEAVKKEVEQVKSEAKQVVEAVKKEVEQTTNQELPKTSNFIDTNLGFAFNLPQNVLDNISRAIANTPHEGFKPVIGFKQNGEVMLTFEPINP